MIRLVLNILWLIFGGWLSGLLWLLGGADPHQPSVLNTLLYGMGHLLEGWPTWAAAQGMLVFQSVFNFFVTSGSAQAAITMPLMAGLGDLLQVPRQVAVLAFDRQSKPLVTFEEWNAAGPSDRSALVSARLAEAKPGWAATRTVPPSPPPARPAGAAPRRA